MRKFRISTCSLVALAEMTVTPVVASNALVQVVQLQQVTATFSQIGGGGDLSPASQVL